MLRRKILMLFVLVIFSGCASTTLSRKGEHFQQKFTQIKKIAVMPINIKMFQVSASGMQEEMPDWENTVRASIKANIQKYFQHEGVVFKFIDEADLKKDSYDLWESQRGLYEAIAYSASMHAYSGSAKFEDKVNHFDYTMGEEIKQLSSKFDADALMFVQGYDTVRTTGRVWMEAFQAGLVGVYYFYFSSLNVGLVDANDGEVLWYKMAYPAERNFNKDKQVDGIVKWLSEDFTMAPVNK